MNISSEVNENYSVIKLNDEKILSTESENFQNAVLNSLSAGSKLIIVDLSKVDFISSWGIGMLIHAHKTALTSGSKLVAAGLSEKILNVLKGVKLDTVIEIRDSVETAINKS